MKKQEFLAKWKQLFQEYPFAEQISKELEDDLTELLSDEDTIDSILSNLMCSGLEIHNDWQANQMAEQVRKGLNNELD